MSSRDLVTIPNPILLQTAESVDKIDSEVLDIVRDMIRVMDKHGGVGLAANQIGVLKRIIVAKINGRKTIMINPQIVKRFDEMHTKEEGCLSCPGVWKPIARNRFIVVDYTDDKSKEHKNVPLADLSARIVQHEIDHLNGICIQKDIV